jgi:hypothetical protein
VARFDQREDALAEKFRLEAGGEGRINIRKL